MKTGSRTVFLVDDGLSASAHASTVVLDPLVRPFNGLGPPIGIRMECAKVNTRQGKFRIEITAIGTVVCPVVRLDVEASLAAPCYEVVPVNRFDECAHLIDPGGHDIRVAILAAWKIPSTIRAATGLVGEFPGHNGRVVSVAGNNCSDIVLERCLDLRENVELPAVLALVAIFMFLGSKNSFATHIVMIPSTQIHGVNVHSTVVGPVVRQGNNELDSDLVGSGDHLVEWLDIDSRLPIIPPLENNWCATRAFASVLWQTSRDCRHVSIVETPCAEDLETGSFGSCHSEFDVGLVLTDADTQKLAQAVKKRRKAVATNIVEREIVCIGAGVVKRLAV
jgi:hypothetical protein